VLNGFNLIF